MNAGAGRGEGRKLRIAAIGDLHYRPDCRGELSQLFARMSAEADVLVLCGDLTDRGLAEEAQVLAADLRDSVRIPAVGVLGNHDFESGEHQAVARVLREAGVRLLDGESCEIAGVGFAGTKGFCGGFGRAMLQAWGEEAVKRFVGEAIAEALKLESALARLHAARRVVVLHYAPVRSTVEGESPEIIPFLGSTRLMDSIDAFGASAVVHGHAHYGSLEGRTSANVRVYNCALALRRRLTPTRPFALLEL